MSRGENTPYSEEQKFFLKNNRELPRKELTQRFNEEFCTQKSQKAISTYCKRYGWLTGRDGRLQKGNSPWNTGTKGVCKPNSGSFLKGQQPHNFKPIGHERVCSKDGCILVKVAEINPYTGANTRYKYKQHIVWEKYFGAIPTGYVIRFKDGDKLNCHRDNLICISKSVNLRMNQNEVSKLPDELKDTGYAIAQLEVAIFSSSKETL